MKCPSCDSEEMQEEPCLDFDDSGCCHVEPKLAIRYSCEGCQSEFLSTKGRRLQVISEGVVSSNFSSSDPNFINDALMQSSRVSGGLCPSDDSADDLIYLSR